MSKQLNMPRSETTLVETHTLKVKQRNIEVCLYEQVFEDRDNILHLLYINGKLESKFKSLPMMRTIESIVERKFGS